VNTSPMFDLRRSLRAYRPLDSREAGHLRCLLAFVENEPRCFERSLQTGHITGSAWLVDRSGKSVLLTHHRKLGKWLQLGGHADGNPDVLAVALREAAEESGLSDIVSVSNEIFDVDVHEIPAAAGMPAHLHYDVRFALQAAGSREFLVSEESHALRWISIKKVHEITSEESMLRMARKWQARNLALGAA
jgi:8-oxo-dGTP pyrophosphatase MutT (NUDIX family)